MVEMLIVVLAVLIVVYLLGPKPKRVVLNKTFPKIDKDLRLLDGMILKDVENNLKKDNQARIVWGKNGKYKRTEYVLLYIHGFSASWYEGAPVNTHFVEKYGCNAFFARLEDHGVKTKDPLLNYRAYSSYESAKEALAIAEQLGNKVIIMSTSTGGTLSLKLAADFPEKVAGLVLYSPNVRIKQKSALLLDRPWGLKIAKAVIGGDFRIFEGCPEKEEQYWYLKYRVEATVHLQQLVRLTMNKKTFSKVTCPVFVGYYYKDSGHQDEIVEVKAIKEMFTEIKTPASQKREVAFPEAGDHVIASPLKSNQWEDVEKETFAFIDEQFSINREV